MEFISPAEWVLFGLFLLALGAVTGFLAGLLGIGGGLVTVPGLYYGLQVLGFPAEGLMHAAVGTSLAIIIATGISSARAHWKKGAVDTVLLRGMGPGALGGVVLGTLIADFVSGGTLKLIFACATSLVAVLMLMKAESIRLFRNVPGQPWSSLAGGGVGLLATLMGIGGAMVSVPYMCMGGVAIHRAVGTASALGLLIAIPAAAGYIISGLDGPPSPLPWSLGHVCVPAFAALAPVTVLVAPFGAKMAHRASVDRLRRIFAVFMLLVAARMVTGVLYD